MYSHIQPSAFPLKGKQRSSQHRTDPGAEILALSSSLLIDRMFLHTDFLETLSQGASVKIWATSLSNPRLAQLWQSVPAIVESFPRIRPFREFPHNYLRRLNEFAWDFSLQPPSRISAMLHIRDKARRGTVQALKAPARIMALLHAERAFEKLLERMLLSYERSEDALKRLREHPPRVLFTTGPFQFEQPAIVAAAKNQGISTLALIPSWDNLSTKNRMVFAHDGYVVWSDQMRRELSEFYQDTNDAPVYVVGAPQFDVFFQSRFQQSRAQFCASQGLRPDLPIIAYALGSPNFLSEHHGALALARRIMAGELGEVQMLVRPHPIHDNAQLASLFKSYAPRVLVQQTVDAGKSLNIRSQDETEITEWVNTFKHADVVVNLSSTVTIDAAILDRPVVNLDYDPQPGRPNQALVKDVNHVWTHFKSVAESGGVWLVNDEHELLNAIKTYLLHPELHREYRNAMVNYVCGYADGRCGERMGKAVLDFAGLRKQRSSRLHPEHLASAAAAVQY